MSTETKIRIFQREDGPIFTYAPELDSNPRMHPGWLTIAADGSRSVTLDVATAKQLNPNSITKREEALIEENADLRRQLAEAQGMKFSKTNPAKPAAPPASAVIVQNVPMQPGETPLPGDTTVIDLTAAVEEELAPVKFAKEPSIHSDSFLNRMRKEDLYAHAKDLNRAVVIPETATRTDLVQICIAEQKAYVERTANPPPAE